MEGGLPSITAQDSILPYYSMIRREFSSDYSIFYLNCQDKDPNDTSLAPLITSFVNKRIMQRAKKVKFVIQTDESEIVHALYNKGTSDLMHRVEMIK